MRPELRSSLLCSSARWIAHLALCLGFIAAAWAETDKSALVQRVTFTVAPAQHGAPLPPPFGLPTTLPSPIDADEILTPLRRDKKARGGKVQFVLLEDIGRPVVRRDIPEELVRRAYESLRP